MHICSGLLASELELRDLCPLHARRHLPYVPTYLHCDYTVTTLRDFVPAPYMPTFATYLAT